MANPVKVSLYRAASVALGSCASNPSPISGEWSCNQVKPSRRWHGQRGDFVLPPSAYRQIPQTTFRLCRKRNPARPKRTFCIKIMLPASGCCTCSYRALHGRGFQWRKARPHKAVLPSRAGNLLMPNIWAQTLFIPSGVCFGCVQRNSFKLPVRDLTHFSGPARPRPSSTSSFRSRLGNSA